MSGELAGLKIVVTRPREQAGKLARALEKQGAQVIAFPTIEIRGTDDPPPFHQHTKFDWTIFTSANAVKFFAAKTGEAGFALEKLQLGRVCAVGPGTRDALQRVGIAVEPLPDEFVAESVFDYVKERDPAIAKKRVLLPRGNIARDMLLFAFRSCGTTVTPWTVYATEPVPHSDAEIARLIAEKPDVVTFTSASTARNFCATLGEDNLNVLRGRAVFASIGPLTTEAAVAFGLDVALEPNRHDIEGLVAAILEWARARVNP